MVVERISLLLALFNLKLIFGARFKKIGFALFLK